jgi:hypothetical protein
MSRSYGLLDILPQRSNVSQYCIGLDRGPALHPSVEGKEATRHLNLPTHHGAAFNSLGDGMPQTLERWAEARLAPTPTVRMID